MKIGELIKSYRTIEKVSTRELAPEIGVSAATLNRVERGEMMDASTFAKILIWMAQ